MTPGEKSLTSTGTRTYVSITPGFSVGRSSNWVIPRPSTPQRRQAWAGQDKSCVETVQLRRKKLKAQIKWGLLSGPHPTVTQILCTDQMGITEWATSNRHPDTMHRSNGDYWVGHIQPSPRYYGITEWATSNRHPDTMGLLSGPHPTVTQILWRLRGCQQRRHLGGTVHFHPICKYSKATFCQQIKTHKRFKRMLCFNGTVENGL